MKWSVLFMNNQYFYRMLNKDIWELIWALKSYDVVKYSITDNGGLAVTFDERFAFCYNTAAVKMIMEKIAELVTMLTDGEIHSLDDINGTYIYADKIKLTVLEYSA